MAGPGEPGAGADRESRPALTAALSGAELSRWYWLRSELAGLARELGVSAAGGKTELTARLVAALDGVEPPPAAPRLHRVDGLVGPLRESTVLPAGQRSTQALRRFFESELGPSFRFDARMRDFIAHGGHTLGEAVAFWRGGRSGLPAGDIAPQFELNAFLRRWHARHPDGSRTEALAAWRTHRDTPVDRRPADPPADPPAADRPPPEAPG